MNIQKYLAEWKKKIDEKLLEYLPSEDTYPPTLSKAMRYTVLAGGKRIRPILLITIYQLCGGKDLNKIFPVACALEFIHSYSLIHDDLPAIDNDDYRRGILSSHKKFGENIAILAGDALFSHNFRIVVESSIDPKEKEKILKVLTFFVGNRGIIGGQVKDVESNTNMKDPKLLRYIHSHKTAFFFSAACEIGGILACVDKDKLISLRMGGLYLGMTFQIVDDILDVEGRRDELGKDIKSDEDKLTYPAQYGLKFSKKIAKKYSELSIKEFEMVDDGSKVMKNMVLFLLGRIK
ncbi:MAG: polyprenyl synthetase family protein [Candidatus Stahlbacteria bacterium]|nr:MAG: polyprenyl synthetase family protein [Candidatus Stahlbacteria bacterium]